MGQSDQGAEIFTLSNLPPASVSHLCTSSVSIADEETDDGESLSSTSSDTPSKHNRMPAHLWAKKATISARCSRQWLLIMISDWPLEDRLTRELDDLSPVTDGLVIGSLGQKVELRALTRERGRGGRPAVSHPISSQLPPLLPSHTRPMCPSTGQP